MKTQHIYHTASLALLTLMVLIMQACRSNNESDLELSGQTQIETLAINGTEATIDHTGHTIEVSLPTQLSLADLTITTLTLSQGATCNYAEGQHLDGTVPRAITVVNGNVTSTYTLYARLDHVAFTSFVINGKYAATIDNDAHTVRCFVPYGIDLTAMQVTYTVNAGTTMTPESGSLIDFSTPVTFNGTNGTAQTAFTVTVVPDDMSTEPKAFIGITATAAELGPEAKAACQWMLANVPNSRYVSIQSLIDGTVKLDDFKMIWCHFDWTDWPGLLWDSRDIFNTYWLHGGAILATRDGARYINDVWRIARDQQSPNNMFGGEGYETLTQDLGISVLGHESHPLYEGLDIAADGRLLLLAKGCAYTNRTLQWGVDWAPYGSMAGWEERTGATAVASADSYDANRVTIAEFAPYEALRGFQSGRVITIGAPAYEWYDRNAASNPYRDNLIGLTKNAINYLCK